MKNIYKLFLDELKFYKKNSKFVHSKSKNIYGSGALVEMAIRKFLKEVLCQRFNVTHGYIYSAIKQRLSRQIDIIITDTLVPHSFKRFDYLAGMEIVPAEAVVGIFEVKRTLNKESHEAAIKHLTEIFEFVPLRKDLPNRYLPGGIEIVGQVDGGKYSNPLIGIIGLLADDLEKANDQDAKRFIDLCYCFDGYFKAYVDPVKLNMYKVYPYIAPTEQLRYAFNDLRKNKQTSKEELLQNFVGYLLAYLNAVSGRPFNMNDYFPNKSAQAEKRTQP